jgi:hypothetical protein
MLAKAVIALVAFPVLAHAVFTATKLVLDVAMPQLVAATGDWSSLVAKAMMGVALLVAARVAFGVCRRLWPTPVVKVG